MAVENDMQMPPFAAQYFAWPADQLPKDLRKQVACLRRDTIEKLHIFIAMDTSGIVAGAKKTLEAVYKYLNERGIEAKVIETGNMGISSFSPVMEVQLPGYSRVCFKCVTSETVPTILDAVLNKEILPEYAAGQYKNPLHEAYENVPFMHEHPFFVRQNRLILKNCGHIDPVNIDEYIAFGGYTPFLKAISNYTPDVVCDLVEMSGLRGRSGSGFPVGEKWKITLTTAADEKFLICNADESDPGAFMDRTLLEGIPHRIIEGIAIASYAIGAKTAYLYIKNEYHLAIDRLEKALIQADANGIIGNNIFNSGYSLHIKVVKGAGAFICGEETALISSIEGNRGMPRHKPPYPSTVGLFGKPTIVNNAETLASIPTIFEFGPQWFSKIGTQHSKGTKIFTVSGKVRFTGLVEIPLGTTFREIIFGCCGGMPGDKNFKSLLIGGPLGYCIHEDLLDTPIDFKTLEKAGFTMGSGGLVVMDEDTCMVDMAMYFASFIRRESCGKCIPCREGSKRMYEILEMITQKPAVQSGHDTLRRFKGIMQLGRLAEVIRDTSLCGLGKYAPNTVLSILKYYHTEIEEHIYDRQCRANVCKELKTFYIDVEKCTGCHACASKCPTQAIIGSPRKPHFIVEEKCIGCGVCYDTCKFVAIYQK
ncbi:MAG: NADH-ubiquinone oxidoreductase-F iron-sulfur binding region domain-containing protein [Bacteroidales bacterium]|nr:NADH-ubiquinone oxidoreductase-F iron-sulfur binding region domain-containing protein [Bacteroidales bacterium]MDD3011074.1 NADH-ubiquinone oxidoreductase-F iron-sulfur binding region domain-containing protein [Bacteroidales bacterium]MDY0285897.1 NADH-ubiquinone oxidoreductase-F iron-sulfur binding region domain-containing protein [Bacteroidales bacterium]